VLAFSIFAGLVCAQAPSRAGEGEALSDQARSAVSRSLPWLEREGQRWIDEKKCVTCHRVSFLTWSMRAAEQRGLPVDRNKLRVWEEWSVQASLEKTEQNPEGDGAKNIDGLAQMILASAASKEDDPTRQLLLPFVPIILSRQKDDGSWAAGGQLPSQKRPAAETNQVTTMWVALALGTVNDPNATAARDRALQFLASAEAGKSTEWHAVKLLLERQRRNAQATADAIARLRSRQNSDGGWGWLVGEESDALGTGIPLYALSIADPAASEQSIRKAAQFLASTQETDGSWKVKGTKANRKDKIEETATYWGTAWAAIGLAQSIPLPSPRHH
jgi:squalene-hopene/tetraprenyl-beta-curcumene cyclase